MCATHLIHRVMGPFPVLRSCFSRAYTEDKNEKTTTKYAYKFETIIRMVRLKVIADIDGHKLSKLIQKNLLLAGRLDKLTTAAGVTPYDSALQQQKQHYLWHHSPLP